MTKTSLYILYVLFALLLAGIFGAVHNQISYTVSPEYFTKFKFEQFGLFNDALPDRWRAAEVGFLASWWMGWPLGIFTGIAAVFHRDVATMRRALLWSIPFIFAFTLTIALCGLIYGYLQTTHFNLAGYSHWYILQHLQYPRRFLCAGYMHNSAYIGGMLAIPATWIFHLLLNTIFQRRGE